MRAFYYVLVEIIRIKPYIMGLDTGPELGLL